MKQGMSTGKATKAEAVRIVACKEGPCMACEVLRIAGMDGCDNEGCDYHHMKSGNIRMGHMYGYALCAWHHRRVPLYDWNISEMIMKFGVSMMDGGKLFAKHYGSENDIWIRQNHLLTSEREEEC